MNSSLVFSDILHEVRGPQRLKSDRAIFFGKTHFGHFWLFSAHKSTFCISLKIISLDCF